MASKAWTRNYDNLFSAMFGTYGLTWNSAAISPTYEKPCYRAMNGNYYGIWLSDIKWRNFTFNQSAWDYGTKPTTQYFRNPHITLGTGEGVASKDDYQLFTPLNSGFTVNSVTAAWSYDEVNHTYTKKFVIPLLYTEAVEVNITEFGISMGMGEEPYSTSYSARDFGLLYHEFLDEPKVLNKNDVIEITFEQSIVQPNYIPYPTTE